ncbi:MAG: hypothetical protein A2845_05000 [Candidatus Lloydbacteria bacterium RIFCSPHIGHO2_01_FULL_49_22]|uniref:Uncharacterized protein n=1 Tax=Candidatus Lloydbacteria bacterium RIFCSPHIGHO2_01_FULL_49_22 TaxID=1798658 RepID=A0A1G2CVS2_9BACT|nr:MAG: hypothetical protein A2845_05000 [Candidatus Lloydbacteria bacterium RIFCSPHIGHO2_01_FULL_49_22]OGZ09485.1 MAG: hypothetical protein A3C14_01555 [Candidatus Lloydbacteria bacterium RIFCSPHIGHO2_02_FULL_50_18]
MASVKPLLPRNQLLKKSSGKTKKIDSTDIIDASDTVARANIFCTTVAPFQDRKILALSIIQ